MRVSIQVWHNQRIISEWDYDPEENQMETVEQIVDLLGCIEGPGDGFTLMANRVT